MQVVRTCEQGDVPIARKLGVNVKLLYHWRSEMQQAGTAFPGQGHSSEEEGMPWKM